MVPLTATGPEVYVATMITIISDSYYSLVETPNQIESLKLKDNQGGDTADCYDAILENVDGLGVPEPLSLSTSAISFASLRILLILDLISGQLRSTRRLWSLIRNLYCVTKTSWTLMI